MLFAEFVQLLHPFFKHLPSSKGIVRYTCNLLDHCFVEGKCGAISDSAAKRYYAGIREKGSNTLIGDEIGAFANDMMHLFDVGRLATYIEECTRAIAVKEDIFNKFNMVSDLNKDNYPQKLAECLQTVMQEAANNYKAKQSQKATHGIIKEDSETIQNLVFSISVCIDDLIDCGTRLFAQMDSNSKAEWQKKYDAEYELYLQNALKLNTYCKIYSYPPFDKLRSIGILDHDAFMMKCRHAEKSNIGLAPEVYLLEDLLLEIRCYLKRLTYKPI